MTKEEVLKAHTERFACKQFDKEKKISDEDLQFILEIARLSPSSIGSEPWKFLVVKNRELREKLRPVCWKQAQITDASDLVAILSRNENNLIKEGYIDDLVARKGMSQFIRDFVYSQPDVGEWSKKQCYIALANIMSAAKMIGVDSCAIEGYSSEDEVAEILGVDRKVYDVAVMVALGYRDRPVPPKSRLDFDQVVEFVN